MGENVDLALKWFFSRVNQAIQKQEYKPNAIILTSSDGTPIYVYDPQSIVDDTGMFISYLRALSGFTDELLGQEKFKVIKIDDHFFFIS
ncbi:MAG: hypothetical protein ACXABK_05950, partial [Candidatus Heimdallarchaeaceae archaeon]